MSLEQIVIRAPSEFKSEVSQLAGPGRAFSSTSNVVVSLASAALIQLRRRDPAIMAILLGVEK